VAVVEDSVLLRAGLTRLLEHAGHVVTHSVGDAGALLAILDDQLPDLCLVDVRLPPSFTDEGIRAALTLRARHPGLPVLVLSQYVEERYATDLVLGDTRGVGYLLKDRVADVDEFLDAVRRVGAGGTALDPEVVSQLLARARTRDPLRLLTPRETDVLRLMAEGRSNAAIAGQLRVSDKAVEKHVGSIFTKFDLLPTTVDHRRVLAVLRFLRP
jgi:DNA-binding NarL/FixJ family response regulator